MRERVDMHKTCIGAADAWTKYYKGKISFDTMFKWMMKHCGNCIYATEDGCSYDDFKYKRMSSNEYLEKVLDKFCL